MSVAPFQVLTIVTKIEFDFIYLVKSNLNLTP